MEAAGQKFQRLVSALDDLVTQEAVNLNDRDFEAVLDLQRRADPIVTALAELGVAVADAMTRARLTSLLARRQGNIDVLESQLATTREELEAVQASAGRIARIAPIYGRAGAFGGGAAGQFSAAG